MKEGDEFSMIFFKLLILLRSLIKLQPQRRDFDAAMAGEENAFVFAAWLYFLFVFRVTNTLSQDKSKFLMLSPSHTSVLPGLPRKSNTSVRG